MKTVNELIKDINSLTSHLHEKDFLLTWEQTPDELKQVLDVAAALKALRAENISTKVFNSGLGISVFRDNSTRTRFSYASALNLLGLAQQDLDEGKSQIAHGETVRETANMISFCADAIGIRDDMYLGAGNAYMREVGAALDDGYKQGVLPQRPALVNLQCDIDHPTQSMADLAWLREHFGSLENLKGKKIAMTWAYSPSYGNPTKPIGSFFTEQEAEQLTKQGYTLKEDAGRGYRRVVASPKPVDIIEKETVKALVDAGQVVITVGGGGIPVIREGNHLRGASAVIDKDWASARLAEMIDADMLIILTAVEKVAINFGKENEQWLDRLSLSDAERFIEEGHFAKGSMLPKVEAAASFARSRAGREALITVLSKAKEGIEGKTGTVICQ
ncbi:knotted carbamoyltransferase YgeW [Escherichia coli]|nr:knotted carbamoyltransferase YgeW [Escherichia coli]